MIKNLNLKPIVLLLLAALFAPVQVAALDFTVDGISYSTTSAWEVEVVRPTGDYQGAVVIPGAVTYDGNTYRVTGIGESAIQGPGVTSVTLPAGTIRTIKANGFLDIRNVTTFTVPASVTEIGANAFKYCDGMTDFYFSSPAPPTVASNSFANMKKASCRIHVPTGSLAAYQSVAEFAAFSNIDEWSAPEIYDLKVAGCLVTEENKGDILGNGNVVYNTMNKTLTISGSLTTTLTNQPVVYNEGVDGLTIQLDKCTLEAVESFCIDVRNGKETTLTGSAFISSTNSTAIYCWAPLTIMDADITCDDILGGNPYDLEIKNSDYMGYVESGAAISGFKTVTLTNCFYQKPVGATYKDAALQDNNGNTASTVIIKAGTPTSYDLYLAGTQVTDANCYDILGNGEASYDPTSNTLTISGDINAGSDIGAYNQISGLTIYVAADVTLKTKNDVLCLSGGEVITGSGVLTLTGSSLGGIYHRGINNITIKDVTVKLEDCQRGIKGSSYVNTTLTIENANVQGTALSGDPFIKDFTKVTLKDCFYEEPAGAKYEDKQLVDLDGNAAASVKIVPGKRDYPELSFPRDTYIASVGKTFTAPELTNPKEKAVTYASSNAAVAEVNATTGEVTVKGKGITTISATYAGDDTYYADKASYYLVVSKKDGLQYDVNGDGQVSITDAVSVVNAILNGVASAPAMDTPQEPAPEANPE